MPPKEYRTTEAQRERAMRYYYANQGSIAARYKTFSEEIKERRKATTRAWRAKNKERKKVYDRQWRIEHPAEWKALTRLARSRPKVRMLTNLRKRLQEFVKQKTGRSSALFGCTPVMLRAHIGSLFKPGMSWETYGTWHIDHIRPCRSFDLSDRDHQRACFHWSNLQPLWAAENIAKGGRWEKEPNQSP